MSPTFRRLPGGESIRLANVSDDEAGAGLGCRRLALNRVSCIVGAIHSLLALVSWSSVVAQEIPRDRYLRYLPLSYPKLVPQTAASAELHLFGDPAAPSYRDQDPVDGVDDERQLVLRALAVRFAPYLVQNTASIPVNFRHFIANRDSFFLHADTWDIGGEGPSLVKQNTVNLSLLGQEHSGGTASAGPAREDVKLLELLSAFTPGSENALGQGSRVRTRPESFHVLFFDFPGEEPETWKQVYEDEYRRTEPARRNAFPHAFVHPFIRAAPDSSGLSMGYELILQYWFFYPSNDGGNNHEGDWEHLNVVPSPPGRVTESLTAADIDAMLHGHWRADPNQAPIIRRVEYYFHHFVMPLDYSKPNVYLPREEWKVDIERRKPGRLLESEIWKSIRRMAYRDEDETQPNTHPIGYDLLPEN